jgi:hypothetical protein
MAIICNVKVMCKTNSERVAKALFFFEAHMILILESNCGHAPPMKKKTVEQIHSKLKYDDHKFDHFFQTGIHKNVFVSERERV